MTASVPSEFISVKGFCFTLHQIRLGFKEDWINLIRLHPQKPDVCSQMLRLQCHAGGYRLTAERDELKFKVKVTASCRWQQRTRLHVLTSVTWDENGLKCFTSLSQWFQCCRWKWWLQDFHLWLWQFGLQPVREGFVREESFFCLIQKQNDCFFVVLWPRNIPVHLSRENWKQLLIQHGNVNTIISSLSVSLKSQTFLFL